LVLDYTKTQLGHQGSYEGMILVDGNWYCPGMPEKLVNATRDRLNKKIDEDTHRARLEERWKYAIVPKAGPDAGGHVRLRCPASNPTPVARCELKPRFVRQSTLGRVRIPVTDALRSHPPAICVKESITVPPDAGAKYLQPLFHESDEWHAVYGSLRAGVEHMNGYVKRTAPMRPSTTLSAAGSEGWLPRASLPPSCFVGPICARSTCIGLRPRSRTTGRCGGCQAAGPRRTSRTGYPHRVQSLLKSTHPRDRRLHSPRI
jgi:hypothetical protein